MSPRTLTIDIETSPHKSYHWGLHNVNISLDQLIVPSRVLCFAAKWLGDKEIIYRSEFHQDAETMFADVWSLLNEADVVVHFNGASFDVPHLNRELYERGMKAPSPYRQVDVYRLAVKQFRFASGKLDHMLDRSGLGHKVAHQGFRLWSECLDYKPKAWTKMMYYNIGDTRKTEKLYLQMLEGGWLPSAPNAGLYVDDDTPRCPTCGTDRIKRDGRRAVTGLGVYQRYECRNGHYSRGKKALKYVELRSAK